MYWRDWVESSQSTRQLAPFGFGTMSAASRTSYRSSTWDELVLLPFYYLNKTKQ